MCFQSISVCLLASGYFFDGHGVTDSMRFHRDKMEVSNCTAADLADATKNPKYRTVLHWHTVWREKNQGPRTGDGMISVCINCVVLFILGI